MPGPPPKDPALRQRRNKEPTAARLEEHDGKVPPFPKRLFRGEIHPDTRAEWRRIWQSPVSAQWLPSEIGGIHTYIKVYNQFMLSDSANVASELRRQAERFGLDVLGRRRLGWTVPEKPKAPALTVVEDEEDDDEEDPRAMLRVV